MFRICNIKYLCGSLICLYFSCNMVSCNLIEVDKNILEDANLITVNR